MLGISLDDFPIAGVFNISRGSKTVAEVVTVTASDGENRGLAESVPYARYGETRDGVARDILGLAPTVTRAALQGLLPAGAARNAVDCALWDLEAKAAGRAVWELAGLPAPKPLVTAFTLSLDTPERMRAAAMRHAARPILKIKLGTPDDMSRLEAVHLGAPSARLIVDANEGWSADIYRAIAPDLLRFGVVLVEQPLPAGDDDALAGIARPVPVCADESCHDRASLAALAGKYDVINIKLDKTGGLTEALALRDAARKAGFGIMVGCMVGTSLAMAPASLVAQGAGFVDLDGPLLLGRDRDHAIRYDGSTMQVPSRSLWG
ncbi:MAG: dipeptide epimerase [Rhodobacteraceae bacterium]|nr:dipeptide epimerase [Paracoccaceae bacterium]